MTADEVQTNERTDGRKSSCLILDKVWESGKKKIKEKVDRLENIYKGTKTYTGMVGNIRVGDIELGDDEEGQSRDPLTEGVEVSQAEAQVLRKDPRFRDWCKISGEDIETDINVGLDNLRRDIRNVAESGGKSLSKVEEQAEKELTNTINHEEKVVDFGKMTSIEMKQNKYFGMSKATNKKDELVLQRLKGRLTEGAKDAIEKSHDKKGNPRESCYTIEERAAISSLKERRREEGLVICSTQVTNVRGPI